MLFGFGFWIQMCRPRRTLGTTEHIPRLITEWLHLESTIDSGAAGITVILLFAAVSGLVVAAWPYISRLRL
jgi:hypothetical protein